MRHPSSITKEEFEHIAKIINPPSFVKAKLWNMTKPKDKSLSDTLRLDSEFSHHTFWFSWEDFELIGIEISWDDSFEDSYPSFNQSVRIKNYLDSIGIDCGIK